MDTASPTPGLDLGLYEQLISKDIHSGQLLQTDNPEMQKYAFHEADRMGRRTGARRRVSLQQGMLTWPGTALEAAVCYFKSCF